MCASSSCSLVQTLQTDHQALKKSSPMCVSQLYITESKQSVSHTLSHLLLSPSLPAPRSVCFHLLICSLNACFSLPLILWIFLCWWVRLLQWLKPVLYLQLWVYHNLASQKSQEHSISIISGPLVATYEEKTILQLVVEFIHFTVDSVVTWLLHDWLACLWPHHQTLFPLPTLIYFCP